MGVSSRPLVEVDRRVIDLMAEVGAHLSGATEVNHYMYFPKRCLAEQAGEQLRDRGFDVDCGRRLPGGGEWRVFASHTAVVSDSSIGLLRAAMERLAEEFGGEYDGWEALVEPKGGAR
jgi:hypothetical protein